jgi:drug/metabolite transporter (DMT)-like permease
MWGIYGILLHNGQVGMNDKANGLFKAFLFVGVAYFLVAIIAPFLLLVVRGANWSYPIPGVSWSIVAGVAGAIGAFGVLLAFASGGKPAVVMSIVFAGAPVINAVIAIALHPPQTKINPLFWLGIAFAALGGFMVTKFKPGPSAPSKPAAPTAQVAHASETAATTSAAPTH